MWVQIPYFICIAFILGKLESPKSWIIKAYFFNDLFESLNVWLHQEKWGKKSSMIRKHKLLKSAVAKGFLILITNFGWQDWVECTIFPLCRPKWDFGALKNEKTRWKMASFHTIRRIFLLLWYQFFHTQFNLAITKRCVLHIHRLSYHSVWKSRKKSHSTLRAKRATFTFWLDQS